MRLKDEAFWQNQVKINDDPYGKAVVNYAEQWANLMEERMAGDESLIPSLAKSASHDANAEGITGFMYGCAVSILSRVWEYGEALRQWHNLDTQSGHEGEVANATPDGVLNPAIIEMERYDFSQD